MLEYFACKYATEKNRENFTDTNESISNLIVLIIAVAAAYLAYEANAHESAGVRIAVTIMAFLFSNIYIIYYFIRYVLIGDSSSKRRSSRGKKRSSGRGKKRSSGKRRR